MRLLSMHPEVSVVGGSSRKWEGKNVSAMFPFINDAQDFPLSSLEDLSKNPQADVAFLALPHGESAGVVRQLLEAGLKVIDLSADLRLNDIEVYSEWYGSHGDPALLAEAVYGLPEINREAIKKALLIANPGCYPTTAILGLLPLIECDAVYTSSPIIDSKSGISGAGRGAKLTTSFCEAGEGFKPYGVLRHRHIPEMEQELGKLAGGTVTVRFTPHLIPASRGMVSAIYVPVVKEIEEHELRNLYVEAYKTEPFVKTLPGGVFPDTLNVRGSNQAHIGIEYDDRTGLAIIMVAIDNLVKGASGAAVQNMNLMMGIEETTGLMTLPMVP
jgi:N-acetyl-gamma-glutamyl-phosphate reductase